MSLGGGPAGHHLGLSPHGGRGNQHCTTCPAGPESPGAHRSPHGATPRGHPPSRQQHRSLRGCTGRGSAMLVGLLRLHLNLPPTALRVRWVTPGRIKWGEPLPPSHSQRSWLGATRVGRAGRVPESSGVSGSLTPAWMTPHCRGSRGQPQLRSHFRAATPKVPLGTSSHRGHTLCATGPACW